MTEKESGEHISSRARNFSGGGAAGCWGLGNDESVNEGGGCLVIGKVVAVVWLVEILRHLNSFHGSWRFAVEEDSESALRFARAARRLDSALWRCSSVISILRSWFWLGFQSPIFELTLKI